MYRISLPTFALACVVAAAACGPSVEVRQDYDPAANFARVHSFAWLGIQASPALGNFDVKRVESVLRAELVRKGMEEKTNGDVYVAAYLGVRPKADTEWEHSHGLYWTEQKTTSPEGALVVDVIDPATGKSVWRGEARGMLQKHNTPEAKTRNIARVAEKIFANFPPQ